MRRDAPYIVVDRIGRRMLQRYLLAWLSLLCLVAYFWPQWGVTSFDPFVASKPYLWYLIMVTMFAIGALLPSDEVRNVAAHWPTVLQGTLLQYITMPLFAYGVGRLFGFGPEMMLGVIIVGCVPGAMASNVLTLAAGGNVSYSVSLTTSATLLSPLFVPAAFWLFLGKSLTISPVNVSIELLCQVVGPVVVGHLLSWLFPKFQLAMQWLGPVIANLAILWIVAAVFALNRDAITQHASTLGGALLLINVAGYTAGFLGGKALRFSEPMRRALTLEIGMQNAGLGTVLASQLYPDEPSTMIPPALYTFGCMLTGTILAQFWRLRPVEAPSVKSSSIMVDDD